MHILLLRWRVFLKSKRERFKCLFNVDADDDVKIFESFSFELRRSICDDVSDFGVRIWQGVWGMGDENSFGRVNDNFCRWARVRRIRGRERIVERLVLEFSANLSKRSSNLKERKTTISIEL